MSLDDHEVHRRALRHAVEHHMSYADALRTIELTSTGPATPHRSASSVPSDSDLDAMAWAHAKARGIRYVDALVAVMANLGNVPNSPTDADAPDVALDRRIRAFSDSHQVSYAEAIDRLQGDFVCFREGMVLGGSAATVIEGQMIEIFRSGRHISDSGVSLIFSDADIVDMAESYDRKVTEAPLTVGHPADNLPSYGLVQRLEAPAGGKLLMRLHQVDPAFAEAVRAGRFKKRSASFYPPKHPNNPKPGHWYLRHVAFLGAAQPSLAGLRDISF